MIIVTGSIRAHPESLERMLALSLEHVRRSRLEHGCLLHSVHQDAEDRLRLVFVEHWVDADALRAHFAVSAAQEFVREMSPLADGPPEIAVYDAQPVTV
ncbi:MAG: antibiotic biosynthesis monooxygenase [Actinomycetota bacterium]|nr:antibiotic biosynthesis monooxygenase [Actinomycetota bacterium]